MFHGLSCFFLLGLVFLFLFLFFFLNPVFFSIFFFLLFRVATTRLPTHAARFAKQIRVVRMHWRYSLKVFRCMLSVMSVLVRSSRNAVTLYSLPRRVKFALSYKSTHMHTVVIVCMHFRLVLRALRRLYTERSCGNKSCLFPWFFFSVSLHCFGLCSFTFCFVWLLFACVCLQFCVLVPLSLF